jgi:hypothetical protein
MKQNLSMSGSSASRSSIYSFYGDGSGEKLSLKGLSGNFGLARNNELACNFGLVYIPGVVYIPGLVYIPGVVYIPGLVCSKA